MEASEKPAVRRARVEDAGVAAVLLHDFNTEFDEPTPEPEELSGYLTRLLGAGDVTVLLGGPGPDGIAVLRLRTSIWSGEPEAHLQELYVVPDKRGNGLGRALLESSMDAARAAGATNIDLNTGETDTVARKLYASAGFTNREGSPDGPAMLFYEREL